MEGNIGSTIEGLKKSQPVRFTKKQRIYLKFKRLMDIVCSLAGLVLLIPVFLVIAAAIKAEDPGGSVLYAQKRLGRSGIPFDLYKFRSMRMGTPELSTHEFYDARRYVTRVGRFIYRTSLDELPQLWKFCPAISPPSAHGPSTWRLLHSGLWPV